MSIGESSRDDVVDITKLVSSMRSKLNYYWLLGEIHATGTTSCMIYKVPQHIREVERHAYEPIVLSIGPYHHGSAPLQSMEKKKWKCLDYILKLNPANDLHDYLKAIATLENQVRNCYTEEIKIESKKFLRMLLLDGCFILVSLYGMAGIVSPSQEVCGRSCNYNEITEEGGIVRKEVSLGHTRDEEDSSEDRRTHENTDIIKENLVLELEMGPASTSFESIPDCKPEPEKHDQYPENYVQIGLWYHSFAVHDLLLLENQIPFCVVKKIYELVAGKDAAFLPMANNISKYVENIVRYYPIAIQESERPKDFHHLLQLCHMLFRPSLKLEEGNQYQDLPLNQQVGCLQSAQQRWHRALQYYEAGIELTKRVFDKYNPHSLLDMKFGHGILDIPCLPVDEHTSCLFRNFIAFEQTCPQFGNYFTAYIVFMSQFISMPEDVTLLAQRGIIEHQLCSDKEVSTLFTELSKDVVFDFEGNYYLKSIFMAMDAHYHSRLNRWMAWLWHNHFSNPWLALAALAAAIVLFCTIVQTLIAVYSYMKPPSDNSNVLK